MNFYTEVTEALISLFSSFGCTAYRNSAFQGGETPSFPYLTYSLDFGEFAESIPFGISVYDRNISYNALYGIVENICASIPQSGKLIKTQNGSIVVYRGSPFVQDRADEDLTIKSVYVNLIVQQNYS